MAEFNFDSRQGGFVDTSLTPSPKRIIVCCDGTWQSSVTNTTNVPSNVTRLARYFARIGRDKEGKEWQQVVYYDAGIGTGVSDMEAKRQGGTGSGFVGNIIEAYNFIVLNYNLGDQIFCFGFSRGAYTARAVAGLVTDVGIIRPRDMQDFPELYRLYQAHTDSHTFRESPAWREWVEGKRLFDPAQKNLPAEWRQAPFQWLKRPHWAAPESTRWVEAVGVFDTVGSLGIPKIEGVVGLFANLAGKAVPVEDFGFHNVALSPFIKHAYHAMALDEHRKPFDTTMWHYPADGVAAMAEPKGSSKDLREKWNVLRDTDGASDQALSSAWADLVAAEMYEELKGSNSKLLQVWFPGVHINIGGGSDDLLKDKQSDFEQIAMITLAWMMEQLKPHLAFELSAAQLLLTDRFLLMRPAVEEITKKKNKDHWLMKEIQRLLAKDDSKDPWNDGNKTKMSNFAADVLKGWATGPIIDSFEGTMTKAGSKYRTPGEYKSSTLQSGETVRLGKTNEQIHPTVKYRMDQLGKAYNPTPLLGFTRQRRTGDHGIVYEWVKNDVRIPEYKIGGWGNGERDWVVTKTARDFLGHVDKDYGIDSWEAKDLDAPAKNGQNGQNGQQTGFGGQTGFQPNNGFS